MRVCQSLFRFRPKSGGQSGSLFSLCTRSDVQTGGDIAGRLKQCCSVNLQIPTGELAKQIIALRSRAGEAALFG